MQIKKSKHGLAKITLQIIANDSEIESIKRHVVGHHAASSKIPGFRSGKAPLAIVERNADQNALSNDFLDHALNSLYRQALESEGLRPVGEPKVTLGKFVPYTTLEFEVETEVIGPIALPDYKKIRLPKPMVSVKTPDITKVLKTLQQRQAERINVSRGVRNDDEVTIDFSATDAKNQPIAGATGNDYPLIVGSNQFIPGFEANLLGVLPGKSTKFGINFPKDYQVASLAGQKANFEVKVKKVNQLKMQKLDDDFAKKSGPFKTLTELKADIKKQLEADQRTAVERTYRNDLVLKIADQAELEVPASLVDEQVLSMEEEEKRNLSYKGVTWQEHLKNEGINEEQHRQRHRPDAERGVKAGLVLSEIAQQEKIEITDQELTERLQALKSQYKDPAMQAELDKPKAKDDIASQIMTEKTIAKLVAYASGS